MPYYEGFKCDHCEVEKKESNHWFESLDFGDNIALYHFNKNVAIKHRNDPNHKILCGDACVIAFVQKWLHEQKKKSNEDPGISS